MFWNNLLAMVLRRGVRTGRLDLTFADGTTLTAKITKLFTFEEIHRQLTPDLATAAVSVGQSGSVVSLLMAMGGSGYVLEKTAADLVAGGRFMLVEDAPELRQPVFAAIHIRHRTLPLHRKLTQLVSRHFG